MADVKPHPTLLRRGVLLCGDLAPEEVVAIDVESGVCPRHGDSACGLWFVPWSDARDG